IEDCSDDKSNSRGAWTWTGAQSAGSGFSVIVLPLVVSSLPRCPRGRRAGGTYIGRVAGIERAGVGSAARGLLSDPALNRVREAPSRRRALPRLPQTASVPGRTHACRGRS